MLGRKRTNGPIFPSEVKMSFQSNSKTMSISDVAALLSVSRNTVTRWAREGRIPSRVTLGGHHRFDRTFIENLAKELERAATR